MAKHPFAGLYLLMAVLLLLPFVLPNSFYVDLAIRMAINAMIVLGLNLLIGFAGQISLGHAGFFGHWGLCHGGLADAFWLASAAGVGGGALAAGLLAALVARPIFKLKGNYLAMAMLGLGIIINITVRTKPP